MSIFTEFLNSLGSHWLEKKGRDSYGDRYYHYLLADSVGRIQAIVAAPSNEGEYSYRLLFRCFINPSVLDTGEPWEFLDLETAQDVAELTIVKHWASGSKKSPDWETVV